MAKRMIAFLLLLISIFTLSACTGDQGPVGPQGPQGEQGEPGEAGEDGVSVIDATVSGGALSITLSDGTTKDLGNITGDDGVSVIDATVSGGALIITLSDGTVQDLGDITGEAGKDGISVINVEIIDESLVITLSDNSVHDLGKVVGDDGRDLELNLIDDELVWRYTTDTEWQSLKDLSMLSEEHVEALLEALFDTYTNELDLLSLLGEVIDEETIARYELNDFDQTLITMTEQARETVVMILNEQNEVVESVGSGVIYKRDNNTYYVVTNHHVIQDHDALIIRVELFGNYFDIQGENVQLLGTDPINDIAVVTFESDFDLGVAMIPDNTQLNVGQRVYAIGHPSGFVHFNSVTEGIIGGLNRNVTIDDTIDTIAIQHDAAISPGNSGGALFNVHGELIGINFAKIVAEKFEGIGYAVPISIVLKIIDDIENYGQLQRLLLGASISTFNPSECGVLRGACILEISENGALDTAGLEDNDVIIGLKRSTDSEYTSIDNFKDLRLFMLSTPADTLIQVQYLRNDIEFETEPFLPTIHPDDIIEE